METQTVAQATIEKLIYGGDGLVRLETGEVAMVPFSAPGDVAEIAFPGSGKKPLRGEISKLVTPAPERVEAPCSVFRVCGGCQWQHLSSVAQSDWKREIVSETLRRIGKLPADIPIHPTLPAPSTENAEAQWHYRNKVQWFAEETRGGRKLGYYKLKTHEVMAFEHCWIIPERLTGLAHWLEANLPAGLEPRSITARINNAKQILLVLESENAEAANDSAWLESLRQSFPELVGVVRQERKSSEVIWGTSHLVETLKGTRFQVSHDSFFQVNPRVAETMMDVLGQWLPARAESMLDLYAGVGTFAIGFRERADKVLAIEEFSAAVEDAKANLTLNDCKNVEIQAGDVRRILRSLDADFEVALLDPPRAGCHADVLAWVGEHVTRQVIYISCDPSTLARDLAILHKQGWTIEAVQPLDMFPQTYHVETLVSLKRNTRG